MKNIIKNGYADKVQNMRKSERRYVWYILHHGINHPKKPNKIRIVFDCAAKHGEKSLNKHLLQGLEYCASFAKNPLPLCAT